MSFCHPPCQSWIYLGFSWTLGFELHLKNFDSDQDVSRLKMAATRVGHTLAKGLGIKLNYRNELDDEIRRGESVFSSQTADTYVETEPHAIDWIRETAPNGRDLKNYLWSLFPFLHWITRYNAQWAAGDLVAGKFSLPAW